VKIIQRDAPPRTVWALEQTGIHPLLAQLLAARGVQNPEELDDALTLLPPPSSLMGTEAAARLLADALAAQKRICVVADYDCDGATACATALRGLRMLGAAWAHTATSYLVPDRVTDGYGLTPAIAQRVKNSGADVLVTVDNGIASIDGVAHARAIGLQVLITDHHLPAVVHGQVQLPQDCVIVNPSQPGCGFPSKSMAGVGVMFYVLLALRAELRSRGAFSASNQPRIDQLLPLVALGTVADVVKLDAHNRRLVAQGLRRIRSGHMPPGMAALFEVAGRHPALANSFDLGFALGPRLNAAGRLRDMTLGIECLATDDAHRAAALSQELDAINRERKTLEGDMRDQALQLAEALWDEAATPPSALCLFDTQFHEGVVGIVASRLKDKLYRPTFVFAASQAPGKEHELKGSGRSIPGFHMRDALDLLAKRHPGVLMRFGGHAMAAGCTIAQAHLATFDQALQQIATEWLDRATLQRQLLADGPLLPQYRRADMVDTLNQQVWGQGFAPPVFSEEVEIVSQRLVGQAQNHLSMKLRHGGEVVDGIWFSHNQPLPTRVKLAYRLDTDTWQGQRRVRFLIEGAEV
jgi:single-stranded-DNA-specific exonuclease